MVFDLTSHKSFENLTRWMNEFLNVKENSFHSTNAPAYYSNGLALDTQFILLGNKCDKVDEIEVCEEMIDRFIDYQKK